MGKISRKLDLETRIMK